MFTDDQLKQLRQVMQEEVNPLGERFDKLEKRLDKVEANIIEEIKD